MDLPSALRQVSRCLVAAAVGLLLTRVTEAQTARGIDAREQVARPQIESDFSRTGLGLTAAAGGDHRMALLPTQPAAADSESNVYVGPPAEVIGGPCIAPDWSAAASVTRANLACDGQRWLSQYGARIQQQADRQPSMIEVRFPDEYQPWWDGPVRSLSEAGLGVAVDQLVEGALRFSSYVHVVSAEPQIRQTAIVEEQGAFDWRAFLDTAYTDLNEPVGNILTTGTLEDRFKDQTWTGNGGFRRRNLLGADVELFQRLGTQQNNSRFLLPNPQATTQLQLQYTQPLLNGAGRPYNESRIVLAQIHTQISSDELVARLEEHLIKVTEAYWELYRARADYFQREKLVTSAQQTLEILEGREGVDAERRQVLRARAAVTARMSEMARSRTSVRNAESRLRLLVNDPALVHAQGREFVPSDAPLMTQLPVSMIESLYTALHHRPDISRSIREVRASAVRLGMARHEVLPKLDLLATTYVAGLAEDTSVGQSFGNQFADGRPTYSVGLLFEVPLCNRSARAREERRIWEMNRSMSQFRLVVEEALTGVEVAVREVGTTYDEMVGRHDAMVAVADEVDYLFDRWKTLPGTDDSAVLLLDNLLDAQDRLALEESAMVRAQIGYAMSIVQLKQEMGTLLILAPLGASAPLEDVPVSERLPAPEAAALPPEPRG